MFDFFKDAYRELNGIETNAKETVENDGENISKNRFKMSTKIAILFIGMVYIFVSIYSVVLILRTGFELKILKYLLLFILDLIIITMTIVNSEKTFKPTIVLSAVFIILSFVL